MNFKKNNLYTFSYILKTVYIFFGWYVIQYTLHDNFISLTKPLSYQRESQPGNHIVFQSIHFSRIAQYYPLKRLLGLGKQTILLNSTMSLQTNLNENKYFRFTDFVTQSMILIPPFEACNKIWFGTSHMLLCLAWGPIIFRKPVYNKILFVIPFAFQLFLRTRCIDGNKSIVSVMVLLLWLDRNISCYCCPLMMILLMSSKCGSRQTNLLFLTPP